MSKQNKPVDDSWMDEELASRIRQDRYYRKAKKTKKKLNQDQVWENRWN